MKRNIRYPNLEVMLVKTHISRDDLSFYIGLNKSTLSAKMTGKRDFKLSEALLIQELIRMRAEKDNDRDISIEELFKAY